MRPSWPALAQTADYMCGTSARLEKSRVLKMLKMDHQSYYSYMVVTLPRYQTSLGIPMSHGSSALLVKITSCRCGKWQKTFTMMKSQKLQHLNWNLEHLKCAW
ncbi:hypothetical protein E2C01_007802 [Portunus trituberculatus]|uniref:Uncharacterized protein n=1 Tax=Portunus trituberculatus TaxID=210409 RepID=A0A5B7D046_PORTR|nr:hypothetical protein [Portunus trituberculatus]